MMETQILIQEIQKKHQITLKPDDPVFVAVTLNDLLLSHYLEQFQALLEEQNKLVISEGIERLNLASAMGSEMINRSLEALSQRLEENTDQVAGKITEKLYISNKQQSSKLQKQANIRYWGINLIIACTFLTLGILVKSYFP